MRHGFIIICQKANGDQCSCSTCLHQALRNSSAGRSRPMVCVFRDRHGVILVNFMSRGHNVNAELSLLYVIVWSVTTSSLQKATRSAAERCHSSTWQWFSPYSARHTVENWTDGLGIVTTSGIPSRLSSKWFSFVWTTRWIAWRHCLRTMKKMLNKMFGSFYKVPTKTSILQASAD